MQDLDYTTWEYIHFNQCSSELHICPKSPQYLVCHIVDIKNRGKKRFNWKADMGEDGLYHEYGLYFGDFMF